MREDYARLSSGRYALAMGDAHTVVDPMMGQGANSASYSAWTIGEAIVADHVYDERFCQRVARRREGFVHSVSDWTNLMLNPPPHVQEFLGAMSQDKALCDEFTTNFNDPERQVDILGTPERTRAYLALRAQDRESAAASDMHRLLVLYPPPADPQAFRDYYEAITSRSPRACPACGAYRWGFDVTALGADSPYFCVFQADFDDAAALDAALGSPEGEATAADVPNYATGGAAAPALRRPRGRARLRRAADQQRGADGPAEVAERGDLDRGRVGVDEEVGQHRVEDALGVGLAEADAQAAADDDRVDVEHVLDRGDAGAERRDGVVHELDGELVVAVQRARPDAARQPVAPALLHDLEELGLGALLLLVRGRGAPSTPRPA